MKHSVTTLILFVVLCTSASTVALASSDAEQEMQLRIEACLQPRAPEDTFEKLKCRELSEEIVNGYLDKTGVDQQVENEMAVIDSTESAAIPVDD